MRLLVPFLLLADPASAQTFAPGVVTSKPLSPDDERKAFVLPPGFEAQLVAADPDIHKPMNIAFDDRGRLWVTDTVEYPWPVKPGEKGRDTVKILEDFGPDGRARKITTFADGLNIPIGLLPLPGSESALVYSIPSVHRMNGRERSPLYSTYGFVDTHGMTSAFTVGFDGWVYACHGFRNDSAVKDAGGRELKMNSGNVYRMRPDGSGLQQHTWGQVNPFGIAFDPMGNLFSADCHSQPIYQLLRGGHYPSFGKAHDGLGFAPAMITGFKGSTAICGIACYDADAFPEKYRGSFYIGDVMTNQLLRFELTYTGSTPSARAVPFLDSKDQWFRPVDVKLGPDGALYVADFYNCIIGHYEVDLHHPARDRTRGRIWRIVYTGKDVTPTPGRSDFTKATDAELIADLGHPNLTVRMTAANTLVARKAADAVKAALPGSPAARVQLLWAAQRLGVLAADELKPGGPEVERVHVQRLLAERAPWTDAERDLAHGGLKDASANVRRAAADAVGRHPSPASMPPLLALRKAVDGKDTHLMHAVRMALRDQLKTPDAWKHVGEDADLIADVALGVPTAEAAAWLSGQLVRESYSASLHERSVRHVARHGTDRTRAALLGYCRSLLVKAPVQMGMIRAIVGGLQEAGAPTDAVRGWADDVVGAQLASPSASDAAAAAELVGQMRLTEHAPRLAELATAEGDHGLRIAALRSLAALDRHEPIVRVLSDAARSVTSREEAATLLARANRPETRTALVAALSLAEGRLQATVASRLAQSREGAEALLDAVAKGKASARLLQEKAVTVQLEGRGLPKLADRLKTLTAGLPPADAKLAALMKARREAFTAAKPDAARGAEVFGKHCAACHQVAGKGAKVGPQLDGIGLRGLERLVEDTFDPNRNVDQAFRTTVLRTKRGMIVQGLMLRQDGAVLVLADAEGKEVRVPEKDVEERTVSNASPMPANFADAVPAADFPHLLAYLLAQRPGGK